MNKKWNTIKNDETNVEIAFTTDASDKFDRKYGTETWRRFSIKFKYSKIGIKS